MKKVNYSIVLPVYNSSDQIWKCITEILKQRIERDYELIVIDDKSKDKTWNVINEYKDRRIVKIRNKINKGAYYSRNVGINRAKGDIIIFIDSDCIANKNWLKEIVRPIEENNENIVQGYSKSNSKNYCQAIIQESYESDVTHSSKNQRGYIRHLDTKNCAIKKEVFKKIGLFNQKYRRSGDLEFGLRAINKGYKIKLNKKAIVIHNHRSNIKKHLQVIHIHGQNFPEILRINNTPLKNDEKIRLITGTLIMISPLFIFIYFYFRLLFYIISIILIIYLFKKFMIKPYSLFFHRVLFHSLTTIFWFFGVLNNYKNLIKIIKIN